MGRRAAIAYEQVKAVMDALRAEGAKPTVDRVWEAFNKAGSKGTIHKLMKQCLAESDGAQTPGSLRQLPADIQQVILTYADQAAAAARDRIADELLQSRQETDSLADENERLVTELEDSSALVEQAVSARAVAEGRAAQLVNELAAARDEVSAERAAAERVRTTLANAELRLQLAGSREEELHRTRTERDAQREARNVAERTAAVLGSQLKAQEERAQELKGELANTREVCAQLETKNARLLELLESERQGRAVAERHLAVLTAVQAERPEAGPKSTRRQMRQGALWQGDSQDGQMSADT